MLHAWVIGYTWQTIAPFHYEFLNGVGVKQKLYIDCHIEIVWFVTKTCVDIISCSIIFYIVSFFYFQLNVDDQILLLKSCCMEVMCLRAACRFDPEAETLFLHNGMKLHKSQIHQGGVAVLIEPIFDFAMGLSKLKLDKAEIALLAAILLMQSGKTILNFDKTIANFDRTISNFDRTIVNFDRTIVNFDRTIVNFDRTIVNFDNTIANFDTTIANFDKTIVNFEKTIANFDKTIANFDNTIVNFDRTIANFDRTIVNFDRTIVNYQVKKKHCQFLIGPLSILEWPLSSLLAIYKIQVRILRSSSVTF